MSAINQTAIVAVQASERVDLTQSPYQIFRLVPHDGSPVEIVLLKDAQWYLLKEQQNGGSGFPIRVTLRIAEEHLALFFHNRGVELFPINDESRKFLALYGVLA